MPSSEPNGGSDGLSGRRFGKVGRAWREDDYVTTHIETVIRDVPTGQYSNPIRIIAFNMSELWSEDPYEDVANELRRCCDFVQDYRPFRIGRPRAIAAANAPV